MEAETADSTQEPVEKIQPHLEAIQAAMVSRERRRGCLGPTASLPECTAGGEAERDGPGDIADRRLGAGDTGPALPFKRDVRGISEPDRVDVRTTLPFRIIPVLPLPMCPPATCHTRGILTRRNAPRPIARAWGACLHGLRREEWDLAGCPSLVLGVGRVGLDRGVPQPRAFFRVGHFANAGAKDPFVVTDLDLGLPL